MKTEKKTSAVVRTRVRPGITRRRVLIFRPTPPRRGRVTDNARPSYTKSTRSPPEMEKCSFIIFAARRPFVARPVILDRCIADERRHREGAALRFADLISVYRPRVVTRRSDFHLLPVATTAQVRSSGRQQLSPPSAPPKRQFSAERLNLVVLVRSRFASDRFLQG